MTLTYDPKLTAAVEWFVMDFERQMAVGELITGAGCTASVLSGTDATPSAILSGPPTYAGTLVQQKLTGGVADVLYQLTFTATTSNGQTLAERASVWVRS